ncbi:MAG: anti-sigma factor [Steroidobacteraceae bacterium]
MNYSRPDLLEQLAASHVLGVMRRGARQRFERLCQSLPIAQLARQRWEDRLLPLALALPPVAPSAGCWQVIQQRIGVRSRPSRLGWWSAAVAASLVALLLVGRLTVWSEPEWQDRAVLATTDAPAAWRLESTEDFSEISVRSLAVPALPADRNHELWILPAAGGNPVSLGLLPASGDIRRKLTATQQALLSAAAKVAVSVEPIGGSPTGVPTGPVIIVADVRRPI